MRSEDWVGHRSGRLTIVSFEGLTAFGRGKAAYFRFRCDCGTEFVAQKSNVIGKSNRTDCGCSRRKPEGTAPAGATRNPLHKVWRGMLDRCSNQKNKSFKDYGARGITVCDRWKSGADGLTGFECFCRDMGERPHRLTIERVKVNGNYEPGNCVWLAKGDQSKNRGNVRLIRIGSELKTIPEWCGQSGVSYWTAYRRIKNGWPPDMAVSTPVASRSA